MPFTFSDLSSSSEVHSKDFLFGHELNEGISHVDVWGTKVQGRWEDLVVCLGAVVSLKTVG